MSLAVITLILVLFYLAACALRIRCAVHGRVLLIAMLFYLAACASPETTRTRGGGPGADVGNRAKIVQMHEGSRPFEKTPKIIPAKGPSLDPANQADQLSRR